MSASPNLRAALFMSVAMAAFTSNDAITKSLTDEMNAGQIMFVRGVFATLFVGLLAWQRGAMRAPARSFHPMVMVRSLCELGGTTFFLLALAKMPIANVSAVLQSLPLAVTMGAALALREPVGWRRWLAIVIGFAGVLVIVRPGSEGFSAYSLSALLCVAFCAVRDLATRRIPEDIPSLLVSTVTAGFVAIFGGAMVAPLGGWTPLSADSTLLLAGAAVLLIPGMQFLILAMRTGDISFVAPFRYTALLWAIVLGLVIFGEMPDGFMLAGAVVVIASGLYSLYRETVLGRRKPIAESISAGMAPDGT
jgi:drug/metabolite transporter (DMT)-like permease